MNTAHALFAADAFYLAFANKDIDAMDELWAREVALVCIHPGWPRLTEREAIMESWRKILGNNDQSAPMAYGHEAHVWGTSVGITCYEALPGGVILASKVFVVEDGQWRLAQHHGSPCQNPPPPDESGQLLQ